MNNELRSEIGIAAEGLNNAWREDLLGNLDDLKAGIGGKWTAAVLIAISKHDIRDVRGFEDDTVSCHESRNELAQSYHMLGKFVKFLVESSYTRQLGLKPFGQHRILGV